MDGADCASNPDKVFRSACQTVPNLDLFSLSIYLALGSGITCHAALRVYIVCSKPFSNLHVRMKLLPAEIQYYVQPVQLSAMQTQLSRSRLRCSGKGIPLTSNVPPHSSMPVAKSFWASRISSGGSSWFFLNVQVSTARSPLQSSFLPVH